MNWVNSNGLKLQTHHSLESYTVIIDPDSTRRVMRFWFYGGPGCLSFHAESQFCITPYGEAMNGTS
jgi:hypothetical protein